MLEIAFLRTTLAKIPGGAYPRTPLDTPAGARHRFNHRKIHYMLDLVVGPISFIGYILKKIVSGP